MNTHFTEEELKNEEWKIHTTDNRYEFSNLGRVRHTKRPDRIFLGDIANTGYRRWRFGKNGKYVSVHRIIASLFHENHNPDWDVHHKDGNKLNNKSCNLESIDHVEHAVKHTPNGENSPSFKSPMGIFKPNGELVKITKGQRELLNMGFTRSIPYEIANRKRNRKTNKGYTFRWLNQENEFIIGNVYNLEELYAN